MSVRRDLEPDLLIWLLKCFFVLLFWLVLLFALDDVGYFLGK